MSDTIFHSETENMSEEFAGPRPGWELTTEELKVLDKLELRESISISKLSKDLRISYKKIKIILESLANKQYAINYGGADQHSLWCAL